MLKRARATIDKVGKPMPKMFESLPLPDFTAGAWKIRKPIFAFDDQH